MINRILMELYDDYQNDNINSLIEFSKKTFPKDGTQDLFIGCVLIMFLNSNGFKGRYNCTREYLLSIVLSAKEKIDNTNLLSIYIDKINTYKGINKYLNKVVNDPKLDQYADLIIDYLDNLKLDFIEEIKQTRKLKELENKAN